MSQVEIRQYATSEVRATGGDGHSPLMLTGYAATFESRAEIGGPKGFVERVMPGCFTRALQEQQDVKCLFNHNASIILGRTKSNTLKLRQDEKGLWFEATLPETQQARDIWASVQRGDVDECSFAFNLPLDGGEKWSVERDANGKAYASRQLLDVDLHDVSAVTYPAYSNTKVIARSTDGDLVPMEIRSAVDAANVPAVPAAIEEKREAEDSLEETLKEVCQALAKAFPGEASNSAPVAYEGGRFYEMETYEDYVIVCECKTGEYFKISYIEDESKPEGAEYTFGEPVPVEKEWVPAERTLAKLAELRKQYDPDFDGDEDSDWEFNSEDPMCNGMTEDEYKSMSRKAKSAHKKAFVAAQAEASRETARAKVEAELGEWRNSVAVRLADMGFYEVRFGGAPHQAVNHSEHAAAADYHEAKAAKHAEAGNTDASEKHKDAAAKHKAVVDGKHSGASDESKFARQASKDAAEADTRCGAC